jgi:hypothetical protein
MVITGRSARLGWSIWAAAITLLAVGILLPAIGGADTLDSDLIFGLLLDAGVAVIVTVGAVIFSRLPENRLGWLILFSGLYLSISAFCGGYVSYSREMHALPAWVWVAWLTWWMSGPVTLMVMAYWLLLFPTGQLLSRRWRLVAWLMALAIAATVISFAFGDTSISDDKLIANPVHLAILSRFFKSPAGPILLFIVPTVAMVASLISPVLRFRRSRGVERQQLKLVTYVITIFVCFMTASAIGAFVGAEELAGDSWVANVVWFGALFLAIVGIPASIGVAILRYRLYDIDRIINKTLVYGALTAILVGIDVSLVIGLEHLLEPVASGSDLIVAGSTLAVAALVRPLRFRIQRTVDRRFYRHKYDATRTLEAFSSRLRDQTDLSALATELGAVVQETMQPAHVSLWVCGATRVSKSHLGQQAAR